MVSPLFILNYLIFAPQGRDIFPLTTELLGVDKVLDRTP